ncbi:hypothetical protein H2200_008558 [Cladophialophora chaetospira]|uniref:Uncharacterized protein n=1 Tax=Cladophialophora chaetospira TaxID=386627 RepID=A0AA39CFS8_9EURO|nr:hypothetical protein H2200_008558 [Cladophialophora chaetospira]
MANSILRTYANAITAEEKKFILDTVPALGDFNGILESFNSELRTIVEEHELTVRKRASLLKILQENSEAVERGRTHLVDTALNDIMGFRQVAISHYAGIRDNFRALDEALTAVELQRSLSTKKRFVVFMWRLQRISTWQIPRYLFHHDPKLRAIYRNLYIADSPILTTALRARPFDAAETDLKCIFCHDHATKDPYLPVLKEVCERHYPVTSTATTVFPSGNNERPGQDNEEREANKVREPEHDAEAAGKRTDIFISNSSDTTPGNSGDTVPAYGLTPCCKTTCHPSCLIPQTDRSEICHVCGANWENYLGWQVEMHELRIRQIYMHLAEWDAEDLQESQEDDV